MIHKVNIREILERQIEVDAGSAEEALLITKSRYDNGDIVLDSEDFMGVKIEELRPDGVVIQNEPKDSFDIYQLKDDPKNINLAFEPYDRLKAAGNEVKRSNYHLVYSAELAPGTGLNDIFIRFNIGRPADFKGHSLSVSDVIVIHRDKNDTAYYVDSYDFKDVPEFLSPDNTTEKNINKTKGEEFIR